MISVAILAGGFGNRLGLSGCPKPMAEVDGRPFLSYLLDYLADNGNFYEIVLCVGYKWEVIYGYFGKNYRGLTLSYSLEHNPLGTGGALSFALPLFYSDRVLVLNGDSFCEVNFHSFIDYHVSEGASVSILVNDVDDAMDFGRVFMDSRDVIMEFKEKDKSRGPGLINAGAYVIEKELLFEVSPPWPVSIEHDLFPLWLDRFLMKGYKSDGGFLDIGTPERCSLASEFFRGLYDN